MTDKLIEQIKVERSYGSFDNRDTLIDSGYLDSLETRVLTDEQALKEANEVIKSAENHLVKRLKALQTYFDLSDEELESMTPDERADTIRQHKLITEALDDFYRAVQGRDEYPHVNQEAIEPDDPAELQAELQAAVAAERVAIANMVYAYLTHSRKPMREELAEMIYERTVDTDAQAALEAVKREARNEALREAEEICSGSYGGPVGDVHIAILALMGDQSDE